MDTQGYMNERQGLMSPREYATKHFDEFKTQLMDWLTIPSISTDPAHADDVRAAATWLADDMRRIGLENVQLFETDGHPVLYADWLHAGDDAPTILVYGHYDVQPAAVEDGWDGDPFTPRQVGDHVIARGATDDKGQVMIQMKAIESLLMTDACPVNVKYLIEGEEEIGSPHLGAFVADKQALLSADICLISDTTIRSVDQPSMTYALRGLVTMQMQVSGPLRDLHSGYGGMIHNPVQAAAEIVAQLHHPDGSVAVPGFYDDVLPLSDDERAMLAKSDLSPDEWAGMMGDLPDYGEQAYTKLERHTARPTLEINGFAGGYAGEGFKTVLPAQATVKMSCRLVADQNPDDIYAKIERFVQEVAPETVTVTLTKYDTGFPALTPINHPAVQAAVTAYGQNWSNDVLMTRTGGSIPIVADFQQLLDVPVVLLGFGLPDCRAHGPNETFNLTMFRKGVDTVIAYMQEIAS